MKFTINKKELSEVLNNLLRAISTKSSIPALEGVLLKTINGQIEMTAYDLEIGMKTFVNANIIEEGQIVISAKLFNEIVKKAPQNIITININEKNIADIESGNSKFSIIGISADEFPELPSVQSDECLKIPSETLKSMLRQTLFAVSTDDSKPICQGSLFNIENNVLDIVSVDGYRLAKRSEPVKCPFNNYFVVPGKTLSEILKINAEEDIEITSTRRHIMFKIGGYVIISSILEGEFVDYKSTIPSNFNTQIKVKTKDFIDSVERISLLISDRLKSPIRCNFENENIQLSCITAMGKGNDNLSCKIDGPSIEMGFNNKYLLDALKNSECDEIILKMTGNINPLIITPLEGDSFTFLVMPTRLRN